jgi:hypothetical protein
MFRRSIATAAVGVLTAGVLATGAAAASADVKPQGKARGATTVTLTEAALGALGPLNPANAKPGVLGADMGEVKASFPIVGNAKDGVIKHTGGLSLNDGSSYLTLKNYHIVVADGVLTADAYLNDDYLARIDLFDVALDASAAPGCDASADLTLNATAAGALSAIFGVGDLTGAPIGDACVDFR